MDNGCQRNKRDPALAGVAGFGTRFDGLPIDVLLEVVSHTNVSSAIKMTMTSKYLLGMQECIHFWRLLLNSLKSVRPIPRLKGQSTLDDVRRAVVTAQKLHIKWSVRHDATQTRSYALAPRLAAETGEPRARRSRTLLLDDGVHVVHADIDNWLKLRRLDTGEVVWEFHLGPHALRGLDCTFHEGDIILAFDVPGNGSLRRMAIWRYKAPGNCSRVYSLDIVNPITYMWMAHASFVRDVYAGCWGHARNIRTISVSNWLTGTHVSFEVINTCQNQPFAMFTDTELLVCFQDRGDEAIIYKYHTDNLASHMTKTVPNAVPTLTSLPPDATYRVEFQVKVIGRPLYSNHHNLFWKIQCREMGNGQIRLFCRADDHGAHLPFLRMITSTLAWPPSTQEACSNADNIVIRAPATLITTGSLPRWSNREPHCTLCISKKTIGVLITTRHIGTIIRLIIHQEILLVDTGGGWGESADAVDFTARSPLLHSHEDVLSLDMDDARGRMAVSMLNGSLVVIEFV